MPATCRPHRHRDGAHSSLKTDGLASLVQRKNTTFVEGSVSSVMEAKPSHDLEAGHDDGKARPARWNPPRGRFMPSNAIAAIAVAICGSSSMTNIAGVGFVRCSRAT